MASVASSESRASAHSPASVTRGSTKRVGDRGVQHPPGRRYGVRAAASELGRTRASGRQELVGFDHGVHETSIHAPAHVEFATRRQDETCLGRPDDLREQERGGVGRHQSEPNLRSRTGERRDGDARVAREDELQAGAVRRTVEFAATTGSGESKTARVSFWRAASTRTNSTRVAERTSRRSSPLQNDGPSPVRTTARTPAVVPARTTAAVKASIVRRSRALWTSGRHRVSTQTSSTCSQLTVGDPTVGVWPASSATSAPPRLSGRCWNDPGQCARLY